MTDLDPIRRYFTEKIGGDRSLLPKDSESLVEEGILDSFGLAELIATVEKLYAVKIPDKDIKLQNVDSIVKIGSLIDRLRS
jgi:acyl carrier protein